MKKYIKNIDINQLFKPKLFDLVQHRSYSKQQFMRDMVAGIAVAVVAIPLSIAFAIGSGVSPQYGIIAAIIGGFFVSFLGGTNVMIGGPTGAFMVTVYGIVSRFGINGLIVATVMAGIILIIMGIVKAGNIIKFIPYPIVIGFNSGIAMSIFSSQIKDFFGLEIGALPISFTDKWTEYIVNFTSLNPWALGIAACTLLMLAVWPYISKKIPGPLVAIIIMTLLVQFSGIEVETIGSRFPALVGETGLPMPNIIQLDTNAVTMLIQPALTMALLGAIISLMTAMVADGATGRKHDANTELIAQGVANIVTPIFGGIPVTGAIARTMTNINNGGRTPVAGIIHAVVLLLILIFLMPLAAYIPLACLAGILVMVAYNMSEWRTFRVLLRNSRADVIVLLTTFLLTVLVDLTTAIEFGLLMAVVLFMKRVSETSSISVFQREVNRMDYEDTNDTEVLNIPEGVEVYEINGPFFFGLANTFDEVDNVGGKERARIRILRMRKVPFIDSTGLHNFRSLIQRSQKEKITIVLSGVNNEVYASLEKSGIVDEIGKELIFNNIESAIAKAEALIQAKHS